MKTKSVTWIARALSTFVMLVVFSKSVEGGSLTVAWDPNTETDLGGYVVYWGTASGVYSNTVDVGKTTQWTITGLTDGRVYYVAVKAYNLGGVQSGFSNEVSGLPSSVVPCTYSLSASSRSLPASGGSGSFNVTTSVGCGWTAVSSASWITVTAGASGSGNGTVSYSTAANAGAQRTGTITVEGQVFTITEAAASPVPPPTCTITLNPTSQSFPSTGGTGTVNVITATGCPWTATSNSNWIALTGDTSGSGNGAVHYSVSGQNGAKQRIGIITIGGRTFTVTLVGRKQSLPNETAAQASFVYTNDNINGPNTVSAFAVDESGALTPIGGSPFLTGGTGRGFGRPSVKGIIVDPSGRFLFVANYDSSDVSVFSISESGDISLVRGGPFKVPGPAHGDGLSLAITPDSQFLMVGNSASKGITVVSVGDDGSLRSLSTVALPAGGAPGGMKVSADGELLIVAMDGAGPVAVFRIASNGTLTPAPGSPFDGTFVNATDIDISCAGSFAFAANGTINRQTATTTVDVFSLAPSGYLSLIPGSPFQPGVGVNSNVVLLSADNRLLFSSDQGIRHDGGDTVTVAAVADDGSLTLIPGSPFSVGGGGVPMGMAMNQTGTLLFTANSPGDRSGTASIGVFRVAPDGSLSSVAGAPFAVPRSNLSHIATVPPAACVSGQ